MYKNDGNDECKQTGSAAHYPAPLQLDMEKYRSRVDCFDITEEQKTELLLTLWDIMRRLAELGYGVDNVRKLVPGLEEISGELQRDELGQKQNAGQFNSAATDQNQGKDDGA